MKRFISKCAMLAIGASMLFGATSVLASEAYVPAEELYIPAQLVATEEIEWNYAENGYSHEFLGSDVVGIEVFSAPIQELAEILMEERMGNIEAVGVEALIPVDLARLDNLILPMSDMARTQSPATALSLPNQRILNNVRAIPQGNWYRWTVWDDRNGISIPGNLNTIVIQAPNNYELIILNSNLTMAFQLPNNSLIDLTFPELASLFGMNPNVITSMNLYLAVQVTHGTIAPQGYVLYYGNTFRTANSGLINTGLAFNFGTQNVPPPLFFNSQALTTNATLNNANIPVNSLITTMSIVSTASTGTGVHNLEIFVRANWDGFQLPTLQGGFESLNVPRWALQVRQPFTIQARLRSSNNFIWRPDFSFTYIFPVEGANMHFIPARDLR